MCRGDHVAVLECAANADGDRLLPDCDVQEARQVAGAEALFDLLLEAPDEQHFAENVLQIVLAQRPLLFFDLRHGGSVRFARCASPSSGT